MLVAVGVLVRVLVIVGVLVDVEVDVLVKKGTFGALLFRLVTIGPPWVLSDSVAAKPWPAVNTHVSKIVSTEKTIQDRYLVITFVDI